MTDGAGFQGTRYRLNHYIDRLADSCPFIRIRIKLYIFRNPDPNQFPAPTVAAKISGPAILTLAD